MKTYLDLAFLEGLFLSDEYDDRKSRLVRLLCSVESPAELIPNFNFEEIYSDPEKRVFFAK